ncbi:MAG: glycosyl hydrolase family 18 protein, partial [Oscillospiraceae bacterium]
MEKKYIFAPYIMENSIDTVRISDILRITHLNVSFAHIIDGEVSVEHLNYLNRIAIYKKINPDLKVILSIGGWGADGFSQAAKTKEGCEKFAKTAMKIVTDWDFDGVDIDWEYPCSDQAGIVYADYDKENYTLLLQELRNSLDNLNSGKKYILTAAVGGGEYFIDGTEMEKVSKILDYVNLMTYDLRGGFT